MDPELTEIRRHLSAYPPFEALSDALLDEVADHIDVSYYRAGRQILSANEPIEALHYVRSGAVEVYRRTGDLFDRLGEGSIFGHYGLLRGQRVHYPALAIEDTLIYTIPRSVFDHLCETDDAFADFVELGRPRLENAGDTQRATSSLASTKVRKLVKNEPLIAKATDSACEAAQHMATEPTAALLFVSESEANPRYSYTGSDGALWQVTGILTDADFRQHIVAEGRPVDTPVGNITSDNLFVIQSDETVQEAMLTMLRRNVHHLVVLHRRRPIGVIGLEDIVRFETQSSLYLIDNLLSQNTVAGLATLLTDVRQSASRMIREGADSRTVTTALSSIARSFMRRLIELAETQLGPPPIPYAFVTLGSMARDEQTLAADQDNALVLDDQFDREQHDAYFLALAKFVSDGLDACGYAFCKGEIMATNPRWRQPLAEWQAYFRSWIRSPAPEPLLHSNIFFDIDNVHGEERFVETLQDIITEEAADSPAFLAAMAKNAVNRTPPIGFFRDFVMEKDGRQNNSINVKRRGTAPLTDLIRIHALACGSRAQNSFERLKDIANTQLLGPGVADRLAYSLEVLSATRLRHQVIDIDRGETPDNNIEPEQVPDRERHEIKEAFRVLSQAQKFLRFRYPRPDNKTAGRRPR